ncbi:hypothetical protein F511_21835 [Dorcoceras hygrometricum]|uniref:Uncharacterized protein n=1 Tax=Dorcoceras hygrometricum TaxID=472368 RepID=A0A2Z7C5V9_9LAMI|nr:hypothetical protein F511_21835 [Dorcoceras hygrometricum]
MLHQHAMFQLNKTASHNLRHPVASSRAIPAASYSNHHQLQAIVANKSLAVGQPVASSKRRSANLSKRCRFALNEQKKPASSNSDPVERTSRPTTGVPAASTDFQMVSLPPAGQPNASTSYHPVLRPASGQPVTSTSSQLLQ